jgi:asparagine synthase (glutamine-hydrolysing)
VADEVERNAAFAPASAALDIARMRALVADWPTGGWETQGVVYNYRLALLRGLGVGHFLRKASGSNQ